MLRQASVYPFEIYSDERIASFLAEDRMTPEKATMLNKGLKKMKRFLYVNIFFMADYCAQG
ncbi:MAG: hypothetical protein WCK00_15950, partial [Deltaproteobacteria bacterium]